MLCVGAVMTTHPPRTDLPPPDANLLVRWFVQYNPMFTASALCVLGGVLLLSQSVGNVGDAAVVGLAVVVEFYQWLVIAVAALLYRRLLERRPAVFLGIIALVFLIDPTLQISALAASDVAAFAAVPVVVLFAAKLHALAWAFRLRLSFTARWLPVCGAVLIAFAQNARMLELDADVVPVVLAFVVFALSVWVNLAATTIESRSALSEEGLIVLPRVVRAAKWIAIGGALLQAWNATFALGPVALAPLGAALLFGRAARATSEMELWALTCGGVVVCGFAGFPLELVVGLPLAAAALLIAQRSHPPRVVTVAIVLLLGSLTADGGAASANFTATVVVAGVAAFALALLLYVRRAWSAVPVLVAGAVVAADVIGLRPPAGSGQWGSLLVVTGFALLPLGLMVHRRLSRLLLQDERRRDVEQALAGDPEMGIEEAPTTSATTFATS